MTKRYRSPNGQRVQVICDECEKVEFVHPYRAKTYKFCSYLCMGLSNRGEPSTTRIDLPIDDIVATYKSGVTQTALAEQHGVSIVTISSRLKEAGVEKRKPTGANLRDPETTEKCRQSTKARTGKNHPHFIDLPIDDIAIEYIEGMSSALLGKKYDVARPTILRKLRAAGVEIRKSGFQPPRQCTDGHIVSSTLEQAIDEWLTEHDIEHDVHPPCPWPSKGRGSSRADFLVSDTYIEVWGVESNARYDVRRLEKLALYKESNAKLIEIYPHHILNKDYSPLFPLLLRAQRDTLHGSDYICDSA